MSDRVIGGLLQMVLGASLFYMFWSGAFGVLLGSVGGAVNGERPGPLWGAVTAGSGQS